MFTFFFLAHDLAFKVLKDHILKIINLYNIYVSLFHFIFFFEKFLSLSYLFGSTNMKKYVFFIFYELFR